MTTDNQGVSREECEATIKRESEILAAHVTSYLGYEDADRLLRLARAHIALLDSSENTIADLREQLAGKAITQAHLLALDTIDRLQEERDGNYIDEYSGGQTNG